MNRSQAVKAVLDRFRSKLGLGEYPDGSNNNSIVEWYNKVVDKIGRGPWCQMTVTWAFWTALPKRIVRGRAYTVWAAQDFVDHYLNGRWIPWDGDPLPGDQVFFDWKGRKSISGIDHVGAVEHVFPDGSFYSLEGNFGNHLVRMHRDRKFVVGFGRPDWNMVTDYTGHGGATAPGASSGRIPGTGLLKLKEDGHMGTKTKVALMTLAGKKSWVETVKWLQWKLNVEGYRDKDGRTLVIDGKGLGSNNSRRYPTRGWTRTITAMQRWLGTTRDGYLSSPSDAVKRLQRKINSGKLF